MSLTGDMLELNYTPQWAPKNGIATLFAKFPYFYLGSDL